MEFQPPNKTKKHNAQASWKRVAVILTNDELHNYYAWFIKKRFNLELNKPIRGSHVTFINDSERETPNFDEGAKLFDKKEIVFYIDPSPRTNGEHWWLRVWSPDAESIREMISPEPGTRDSPVRTSPATGAKEFPPQGVSHRVAILPRQSPRQTAIRRIP